MKYAIFSLGAVAAGLFVYSIYSFWVHPEHFKTVAYVFMFVAAVFFVLVIIRKIQDEKKNKRRINSFK